VSAVYEIHVCPLCGSQCNYDGGYEGEGWIFECEHLAWGAEYGELTPLTLLVDAGEQVRKAVEAAAPAMEKQKRDKVIDDAERREREVERRYALTPEEREREDRFKNILREMYAPMLTQLITDNNRVLFGDNIVIPKARG
jgi:hypothetical protein